MNPDAPTAESGLIQAGYQPRGENGIPGRRYFTKGVQARTHQIHAFLPGNPHIIRHLAFRDYLRHFPAIRHEYAAVKYAAQRACQGDMKIYCALKHDFIQFHQQRALALFPF
ncbi:GrpB protein [Pantoea ananatis]|nr:GrpB family protein [Pantoea ananatis]PVY83966.1 GrpB protein [Pantoea ananatis]